MNQNHHYRLALDMGTNSIGWGIYGLNGENEPESLENCGVRIFSDGRADKSKTSLKADRRITRLASRRRDRFLSRQENLLNALVKQGLMPKDNNERQALVRKNPWIIRKKALDKGVHPHEMGRALFHINQRRAFQSNRLMQDEETGVINSSIAAFKQKLKKAGARTVGEFLADRKFVKEGENYKEQDIAVRARRSGTKQDDLYDFYPDRQMLKEEFDTLWAAQQSFHPECYTDESRDKLRKIIFDQRPLKPQIPGRCRFLPCERRAARALPSFQCAGQIDLEKR